MTHLTLRVFALLLLTLVAFAGNSVLTRAALVDPANGATSFAAVRLLSGALMLGLIGRFARHSVTPRLGDLPAVLALFLYVLGFSLAYRAMSAATGALILFAFVQITMLAVALRRGVRLSGFGWLGLALALGGLVWLLSPGLSSPPLTAALLMSGAGVAWGAYSILGQGGGDPVGRSIRNFIGAVPLALVLLLVVPVSLTASGWALSIASGALASALGYVLWYRVLPLIPVPLAASAQLSVPVITALGGALLLSEPISLQLVGACALVLTGIALSARK
ncbi:DMT family transporter [Celeribacter halophilus]|uniref:DMT family transporter n=1 Tax=Celeribacter halophilus TaxID=576117 RepID=A0AAW7XRJ6_9RHOB|nr:DMT family transporter [Celeribacter halophilus]MDO6456670.1 DMT family transporter [Celeribacter halophilus]MDO6723133.1 DMT family transporter [Celeribacter halophilus]